MYLFILLLLNFTIYKYLYTNFYKTSEQLNVYPQFKEILNKFFLIPGKIM